MYLFIIQFFLWFVHFAKYYSIDEVKDREMAEHTWEDEWMYNLELE
jgi:hypothetical protein